MTELIKKYFFHIPFKSLLRENVLKYIVGGFEKCLKKFLGSNPEVVIIPYQTLLVLVNFLFFFAVIIRLSPRKFQLYFLRETFCCLIFENFIN